MLVSEHGPGTEPRTADADCIVDEVAALASFSMAYEFALVDLGRVGDVAQVLRLRITSSSRSSSAILLREHRHR